MLLSSTKRTAASRLPVFAVLSINWTLERALVLTADLSDPAAVSTLHGRLWALRRLALCCAALAAARAVWRHIDPDSEMRNEVRALAVEVRRQSSDMIEAIERYRTASLSPPVVAPAQAQQPPQQPHEHRTRGGGAPSGENAGSPAEERASRSPVAAVPCALRSAGTALRERSTAQRTPAGRSRAESSAQQLTANIGEEGSSPAQKRRSSAVRSKTPVTGGRAGLSVPQPRTIATRSSAVKAKRPGADRG